MRTPIVWKNGITPRPESPCRYWFWAMWAIAAISSLRWLRGTPFWAPGGPGGVEHQACRGLADRGGTGERGGIAQSCEWHALAFAVGSQDPTARGNLERRSSPPSRPPPSAPHR